MEWDQKIFRWFWRRYHGMRGRGYDVPPADPGASLEALDQFARLVSGKDVKLVKTTGIGGRQGDRFLLPFSRPLLANQAENLDFFRLRILLMANQSEAQPAASPGSTPGPAESPPDAGEMFVKALRRLQREYPRARNLFHEVKTALQREEERDRSLRPKHRRDLRAQLIGARFPAPGAIESDGPTPAPESEDRESQEELVIETIDEAELLTPDEQRIEDYTLGHNFEKLETLDDFNGQWRDLDQEDDLREKEDAVNELQFRHRVRTAEAAQSVLSADVTPGAAFDMADQESRDGPVLYYDEWDYAKRSYRKDFCRVFSSRIAYGQPGFADGVLRSQKATLERIDRRLRQAFQERETVRRQTSGEDPDLDAIVAARADLRAGRQPDERLYLSRRKRRRDMALSFLMDLSLSTDAYVAGRRALDVEREALLIFGEALSRHAIPFSVDGFYSRTRNECDYIHIKNKSDDWRAARDRLGRLLPRGYTRMGPAIRRATELMENESARQRWIVLFTDGKPNDYDRYEGRYGIQDVRQAVREAEAQGIHVQAFAIDRRGRPAFREMLGEGCYRVLQDPEQLPDALGDFFLRILTG